MVGLPDNYSADDEKVRILPTVPVFSQVEVSHNVTGVAQREYVTAAKGSSVGGETTLQSLQNLISY